MYYVRITDHDVNESIEIPTDDDGTIQLSNLALNYPGLNGLKYQIDDHVRLVKVKDDTLFPPEEGWGDRIYCCMYPKDTSKRKSENDVNSDSKHVRLDSAESKWVHTDLVVLGLPWKTTDKELHEYFTQFGELLMAQVKVDRITNQPKGYGFIRFVNQEVQVQVMLQRHCIGGRWCDVRIPVSKDGIVKKSPCKIFVGQCTEQMTEEILRDHFSKFGKISDLYVPKPFRGFAFVTFVDSNSVRTVCNEDHVINGTKLYITEAIPKETKEKYDYGNKFGGDGRNTWNQRDNGYRYNSYDKQRSWNKNDLAGNWNNDNSYNFPTTWNHSYKMGGNESQSVKTHDLQDTVVADAVSKAVMGVIENMSQPFPMTRNY